MNIVEKIDKLRKEKRWTKSMLATQAGITPNTVYNWYNDKKATPTRESIENVCAALGVSVISMYADVEAGDLTAEELELLEAFRKVPDKKKGVAIATLKAMCE
ncbi:MAG: helix-turn-helix transcriptional regulator [Clostridiales bacterium]|nr:helix-turn-helix transcriptional regulator [Clostridiales bacterium]